MNACCVRLLHVPISPYHDRLLPRLQPRHISKTRHQSPPPPPPPQRPPLFFSGSHYSPWITLLMERFARTSPAAESGENPAATVAPRSSSSLTESSSSSPTQLSSAATRRADAKVKAEDQKLDKRSVEYVLRSGLAGGLAGCAVSSSSPVARWEGENGLTIELFSFGQRPKR